MDWAEEELANNLMESDVCLWLVRARAGNDDRKGWHGGPAGERDPGHHARFFLNASSHLTAHGTQRALRQFLWVKA